MAETQIVSLEREYIIPLRREWRKVANYRRTGRAVKAIKKFIARHMKIPDRDVSKVKVDVYLNNEIWFRGRKKPPAKIKVKAIKEGEIVKVQLVEIPEYIKFLKQRHERLHKAIEKIEKPKETVPAPTEEKKEEKSKEQKEEKKIEEQEKEKAVAEVHALEAKQEAKAQKHITKVKKTPIRRLALKK